MKKTVIIMLIPVFLLSGTGCAAIQIKESTNNQIMEDNKTQIQENDKDVSQDLNNRDALELWGAGIGAASGFFGVLFLDVFRETGAIFLTTGIFAVTGHGISVITNLPDMHKKNENTLPIYLSAAAGITASILLTAYVIRTEKMNYIYGFTVPFGALLGFSTGSLVERFLSLFYTPENS
ncbi:MAG: hypothetical protein ACLFP1_06630 [Candidatus Goldiibacteriota bacterium]